MSDWTDICITLARHAQALHPGCAIKLTIETRLSGEKTVDLVIVRGCKLATPLEHQKALMDVLERHLFARTPYPDFLRERLLETAPSAHQALEIRQKLLSLGLSNLVEDLDCVPPPNTV